MIYWEAFTWEAFATLATGASAVGAAIFVARWQRTIAERQTAILADQAKLADLQIRANLFDRRVRIYDAARTFVAVVMGRAAPPTAEQENEFVAAIVDSEFLFRPEVHEELRRIWKLILQFNANYKIGKAAWEQTGRYPQGNPEREQKYIEEMTAAYDGLPALFRPELGLHHPS